MNDDDGFTLPELLVSMLILTLVITVVANCFVLGLRTTDSATKSFAHSRDTRSFSSFFATDVESAKTVESTAQCGGSLGGAHVLSFKWLDQKEDGSTTPNSVSYFVQTSGSETQLVRRACAGGGPVAVVVAHELQAGTPMTVKCDGSTCPASSSPAQVTATLTATDGYSFSIAGRRRTS
jgi:prepilin-type N-terminal cleavage/methylation domain-containing protein